MLLLNDGMVRSLIWEDSSTSVDLGMWLYSAVFAHNAVVATEPESGSPGVRTVISSGWAAEHSFGEVRVDDLVYDYTRKSAGMSVLARQTGNPVLVSNPPQLQLNTAFSRAFLLDEAGSKHGIAGAALYVDASFLRDVAEEFSQSSTIRINDWTRESDRVFAVEHLERAGAEGRRPSEILTLDSWMRRQKDVSKDLRHGVDPFPSRNRPWVFGLLLDKNPISVVLPSLSTTVFRVIGYFPHDEDPADFIVEL